jgi:hypothetical protein
VTLRLSLDTFECLEHVLQSRQSSLLANQRHRRLLGSCRHEVRQQALPGLHAAIAIMYATSEYDVVLSSSRSYCAGNRASTLGGLPVARQSGRCL